jgi:hypothetical protein
VLVQIDRIMFVTRIDPSNSDSQPPPQIYAGNGKERDFSMPVMEKNVTLHYQVDYEVMLTPTTNLCL